MPGPQDFSPQDLRLMQGLAQQVTALRPELVNSDATVGEMAWVWGKDRTDLGGTWRHRLCFSGGRLAGWGWIFLPYRVMRSDGQLLDVTTTSLTWQVHPDARQVLDDILDWYDTEAPHADRRVTVRAADDERCASARHQGQARSISPINAPPSRMQPAYRDNDPVLPRQPGPPRPAS